MRDDILNFHTQFDFEPKIECKGNLPRAERFVLCGMGGSHLAADLLQLANPKLDFHVHQMYGVPTLRGEYVEDHLLIASSYSGNTEEVVDFAKNAWERSIPTAVVATGGKLIALAKGYNMPHVVLPATGIQPRSALGYSILGIAKIIGEEKLLTQLHALKEKLKPEEWESLGQGLAETIGREGKIPVIYTSAKNRSIGYNWKIKCNETGKVPAFYNVLPELNHNEMASFDVARSTKSLTDNFHFIFIEDENDHERVKTRMKVTRELYEAKGLPVTRLSLRGEGEYERIFNSLLLADWTALYLARFYGREPEKVALIEEFKKRI